MSSAESNRGNIYNYKVEARDLDFTGTASLVALCNYILQAAGQDADRNGFGVRDLNCGNCSWVLSRMCIETTRDVRQDEVLAVRTWVSEVGRLMTTRNMVVECDGEVVARVVTQWAIIGLDDRRPIDIRKFLDPVWKIVDEPSPAEPPHKLREVTPVRRGNRTVSYTDLDFNRHANSMKYLEWALDTVELYRIEKMRIERADLNFIHETVYGQPVEILASDDTASSFAVVNSVNGETAFRLGLKWTER